ESLFALLFEVLRLFKIFLFLPHAVLHTQNGRVAIVMGGARGMGYETARHLASLGMHVVIAGNSEEEGLQAVKKIHEEGSEGKVEFLFLGLCSLKSVRQFVHRFKARALTLHIPVNNACIMLVSEGKTEDSFELHFGLNYLGHFLLTNLLLDKLKRSGRHDACSRVVTMSSATHYVGILNMEDLHGRSCYSELGAYSQSKLSVVLFTYHLQEKLTAGGFPVTSKAVDPVMVDTDLYNKLCIPAPAAKKPVAKMLFRIPAEGASTAILAATASQLEGVGGCYFYNGERTESADITYDHNVRAERWKQSCALVGLREA
uniref:Dehydrogenase/reductase (SDR family) X-linked n=2 Tax=Salmo trutta TaxID=8032 RepID=A0A674EQ94_SALTR